MTLGSAATILLFRLWWNLLVFFVYGVSFTHIIIKIVLPIFVILVLLIFDSLIMHPNILFTYFQDGFGIKILLFRTLFILSTSFFLDAVVLFGLIEALAEIDLLVTAPTEILRTNMAVVGLGGISVDRVCRVT